MLTFEKGFIGAKSDEITRIGEQAKKDLRAILGPSAEGFINNKNNRDGGPGKFHVTLVSSKAFTPWEVSQGYMARGIATGIAESCGVQDSEPRYLGLGRAEKDGDVAYFAVLEWPEGAKFSEKYAGAVQANNLHVTVGFSQYDVHGVPKDKATLV